MERVLLTNPNFTTEYRLNSHDFQLYSPKMGEELTTLHGIKVKVVDTIHHEKSNLGFIRFKRIN